MEEVVRVQSARFEDVDCDIYMNDREAYLTREQIGLALTPSTSAILSALLGVFLGGSPLLILALFSHSIGGGDVKLTASAGLALGWRGSYLALLAGLVGFVLYGGMKCPVKKNETSGEKENPAYPFAPPYAVGCVAILVLSFILRHSLIL